MPAPPMPAPHTPRLGSAQLLEAHDGGGEVGRDRRGLGAGERRARQRHERVRVHARTAIAFARAKTDGGGTAVYAWHFA